MKGIMENKDILMEASPIESEIHPSHKPKGSYSRVFRLAGRLWPVKEVVKIWKV